MARLTLYRDNFADSTMVSNCFIDEFMKDANDAQLKVYLYLVRMLSANQTISVSDIADKFNHTERDVLRALSYWENQDLLTLDFDRDQNLTGIHLRDLTSAGRDTYAPTPSCAAQNISVSPRVCEKPSVSVLPQTGEQVSTSAPSRISTPSYQKPEYTPEELRSFQEQESTAQLLFIAQSYIGRPLSPGEMKSILFFTDGLHFSDDLVDYLLQYCVDRGKKDFKYIEKVAINWAEAGITTPQQAQATAGKYDKNVYAIMNQLGKNTSPTLKEMEYINRWTKEFGFSADIIFEACERTVLATDKHRFEYADRILSSWKDANVHYRSDILRIDDAYQQKRKNNIKSAANRFNQFEQNNYNFEELERELLSN